MKIVDTSDLMQKIILTKEYDRKKEVFHEELKKLNMEKIASQIIKFNFFDFQIDSNQANLLLNFLESNLFKRELNDAYKLCEIYLNMKVELDLIILPLNQNNIFYNREMKGIVAHTIGKEQIIFYINPNNPKIKSSIQSLFIHEYQHLINNSINNRKSNLMDIIIDEGFSELLVEKTLGEEELGAWANRYSGRYLIQFNKLIWLNRNSKDINLISTILNGSEKDNIPLWLGYSYGYNVVKNYSMKNNNLEFLDLITMDNENIISNYIGDI
ncbi:DUF2268 domain-containing putative Zn-dependent protease [Oceanobacillus oncorhynchi]|uniref:DUF2268 domain-containing putative Zn-dependent protease n=1 Tax=Oceanobacillus oncorhynchi TaxID=545501 RepID=UPI0018685DDE|nr:DUF2268 domain-containing putative Zn-dependent protease [Oceanobacillus oncorhynchi]